ncbi:membrane protein [Streptomyces eurocidicus]|uniref:Membrane protein n=1 Tax=Streptomyces eurocidicus TaxID=66423 RepID=A0A2N8P336_STREU|nr:PH domain-containing protein [Streptomyces eurocidicus]MBB5117607.1 putative membrane protein [Streptomyces eurocidicus]MBF6053445.1 PH domain-containing protein [Streptomyces eurocidicus]PNE35426.1 membrane protein [Streptomyces eurocidicus]
MSTPWRTLDPRTPLVHCAWLGAPLGSLALTALATGGRLDTRAWITLGVVAAVFACVTTAGLITWRRTRYRVTADSFELRTGLFTRRLRAIPLHRVRNVDLTANPVQRLLGLAVLRAGTGGHGGELSLEALARPDAVRLRAELLARAGARDAAEPLLAAADLRRLRYAPLTFWVFGGVLAAAGAVWRVLDGIGVEPWRIGLVRHAFEEFGRSALWLTVPFALLAVTLLGVVGAVALYAENWWNYRLEWADADTLRVRRGMFTTRSVSIERARLRGVTLREPLLLRAGGGASVRAVAGGLGNREENRRRSVVLPPAPRAEAVRVCAGVLGEAEGPLGGPLGRSGEDGAADGLRPHPRAALRRRVVRALAWAVPLPTAALAVLGWLLTPVLLYCAAGYALLAAPVAYGLARDAYRGLGHGVRGRHLVVRSGTFGRETTVLERRAVQAWTFTDTPFGRRAGLVTATAAVAGGEDGYRIRDMSADDAAAFADAATPGILAEFIVPPVPR